MFEARLRASLIVLALVLAVLIARFAQLQIVRADYYRDQANKALVLKTESLPFARGRILDRFGRELVGDEPCWEIQVDFNAIAADAGDDSEAWELEIRRARRRGWLGRDDSSDVAKNVLGGEFSVMWDRIAVSAAPSRPNDSHALRMGAREIYERVQRLRKAVAARRGFESPVAEERTFHPVVTDLDRARAIDARETLAPFPWVRVQTSSRRAYVDPGTPFAHILGRLGMVTAEDLADDPEAEDPFARYTANERRGTSGVEWLAERELRGRRGQVTLDRNQELVGKPLEPQTGQDVTLTLHAELQRKLYDLLDQRIRSIPESSGGSIVVLDVASREVLALVSYPSFDPARFDEAYPELAEDTERLPLSFRAVAGRYAPGSIVKPLVMLTGLMNGKITLESREECRGHLLPDSPDRWRCWEVHGTSQRMAHGSIDVVEALRGSCNVFMFRLGERIGVDGLCGAFDMVGLGRLSGIGLREENSGINPTPEWLAGEKATGVYPAHARLFAIGQGEIGVTPLQAAALAATYAGGRFVPASLIRDRKTRPSWTLPYAEAHWAAVRRGLYEVVNHPEGTAHKHAYWKHPDYALCGKTGSATAFPWPTAFRVPYVDDRGKRNEVVIRAGAKGPALERLLALFPDATIDPSEIEVASTWPRQASKDGDYSHAWFAGYLQPLDSNGRPDWRQPPPIAFSVLVEFGGSGGRTSGPIARDVAQLLVETLGPNLLIEP